MGPDENDGNEWLVSFDRRASLMFSIMLFAALVASLLIAWWLLHQQWQQGVQRQVDIAADQAAMRLQDYVRDRLFAIMALVEPPRDEADGGVATFTRRALELQERFGGFQALNWIDSDGTIRIVTPREANQTALGRSVLGHPVAHTAFAAARATGETAVTWSLELFQGGRGFAAYVPLKADEQIIGYINGVFRIQPLIETSLRGRLLSDYLLEIVDDSDRYLQERRDAREDAGARPSATVVISILDRDWRVSVVPRDALWDDMRSARPDEILIGALLLIIVLAWLVHSALQRQINEATADSERQQLRLQLQRNAKLDTLGRLAAGVAHDFGNAVAIIRFNAEQLVENPDSALEIRGRSGDILAACDRAAELSTQLGNISRPDSTAQQLIDLNGQLRNMTRVLESLLLDGVALRLECSEEVPMIRAAPAHIAQIIVTLASNTSAAMSGRGELCLRTTCEGKHVLLDFIEQEISDTPSSAQDPSLRFPDAARQDAAGRSGMGLAAALRLVEICGGTMAVGEESTSDAATRIRFPRASAG